MIPMRQPRRARKAFLLAAVLAAALAVPAAAQDASDARQEALRYVKASEFSKMTEGTVRQLSMTMPAEKRRAFVEFMNGIDIGRLESIAVEALVASFTADEIRALAAFYDSATGRSIMQKMPVYMASVMPGVTALLVERMSAFPR